MYSSTQRLITYFVEVHIVDSLTDWFSSKKGHQERANEPKIVSEIEVEAISINIALEFFSLASLPLVFSWNCNAFTL